ncbi:MAG: hypothetical protein ACPHM0_02205, partial [Flavobacteriales bacterium]
MASHVLGLQVSQLARRQLVLLDAGNPNRGNGCVSVGVEPFLFGIQMETALLPFGGVNRRVTDHGVCDGAIDLIFERGILIPALLVPVGCLNHILCNVFELAEDAAAPRFSSVEMKEAQRRRGRRPQRVR